MDCVQLSLYNIYHGYLPNLILLISRGWWECHYFVWWSHWVSEGIALGYVYTARLCAQFWFIALFLFFCLTVHFFTLFSPSFHWLTVHFLKCDCYLIPCELVMVLNWPAYAKSAITKMWDAACWRTEVNIEATCCWCSMKAIEFKSRWWWGEHKDKRASFVIMAFMEQRMLFCKEMYAETEPRAVGLWQVQSHEDFIQILRSLWLQ